jgi:ABC-type glycerol-3-phosphate transport system permease component
MTTWNDVLWPIIVMRDEKLMTMPQLVTLFAVGGRSMGQIGNEASQCYAPGAADYPRIYFFSKYFIQSLAASGQKE